MKSFMCPDCDKIYCGWHYCQKNRNPKFWTRYGDKWVCPDCNFVYDDIHCCQKTQNARFWIWHNDGWVKITLEPGQKVNFYHGGRTEEGFSRTWINYEFCDGVVFRNVDTEGRDCDGRMDTYQEDACEVEHLKDVVMFADFPTRENNFIYRPAWKRASAGQRDYAAEAMNY